MKPEKKLILLLWVPATIGILMFVIGDLLWAFGNPCLITDYYTSRFDNPIDANIYLLDELGIIGCLGGLVLLISYLKLTFYLFKK